MIGNNIWKKIHKKINNKAQGLPLNVVIIAAIVLIVMVVLIVIFRSKIGGFGKGLDDQTKNIGKECEVPGTSRQCVKSIGDCRGDIVSGSFLDCEEKLGRNYACCES